MDIALVGAAYNGLKFAKDALKLSLDMKVESESRVQVHAAMEKLGGVQDSLFELREQLFSLQSENDGLRRQLAEQASWQATVGKYELVTSPGGAVVYRFCGEPQHFACPSCFHKQSLQFLQDRNVMSGSFVCTGCKSEYRVKPSQHIR